MSEKSTRLCCWPKASIEGYVGEEHYVACAVALCLCIKRVSQTNRCEARKSFTELWRLWGSLRLELGLGACSGMFFQIWATSQAAKCFLDAPTKVIQHRAQALTSLLIYNDLYSSPIWIVLECHSFFRRWSAKFQRWKTLFQSWELR